MRADEDRQAALASRQRCCRLRGRQGLRQDRAEPHLVHETRDHAMEVQAVEEAALAEVDEVARCPGNAVQKNLGFEAAHARVESCDRVEARSARDEVRGLGLALLRLLSGSPSHIAHRASDRDERSRQRQVRA